MPRLGDILVKSRQLTESQLQAAMQEQRRWGGLLGEVLLRLNYVTEAVLVKAVTRQTGIPEANLAMLQYPDPAAQARLTIEQATQMRVLPLQLKEQGHLLIAAMVEPQNPAVLDELRKATGCRISPQLIGPQTFRKLLNRHYGTPGFQDDPPGASFRMVDPDPPAPEAPAPEPPPAKPPPPTVANGDGAVKHPQHVAEALTRIENTQRHEVAVLRAMVELLIDRGVFTREEYLARVRK